MKDCIFANRIVFFLKLNFKNAKHVLTIRFYLTIKSAQNKPTKIRNLYFRIIKGGEILYSDARGLLAPLG